MSHVAFPAPVCLVPPEPGDFCCVPISGSVGTGIELGQYVVCKLQRQPARLLPYDHVEVYVGQPDDDGPFGYTYSAYPDNGRQGRTGKRALSCPPAELPGSLWSSGLLPLDKLQRQGIMAWCVQHGDVTYAWDDYGAIAAHALHLPVPGLRRYISSTKSLICSQYADMAWSVGGAVKVFDDFRWPGYVTPWDLAAKLLALVPEG